MNDDNPRLFDDRPPAHTSVLYRRVPKTLHDMFKGHCHARGVSMREMYIRMMRQMVRDGAGDKLDKIPKELR